jgi:ATP-binding cassette subfamily F protein 3
VLLEALRKFTGTVVFVSHDRYFIDALATRIFEIEGGELRDYPGNYEDYLWQKEHGTSGAEVRSTSGEQPAVETSAQGNRKGPETHEKRNPQLLRKMKDRRDELEEEIARCEAEITTRELELANFKSAEESIRLAKRIEERRGQLEEMTKEWEQIALALEEPGEAVMGERS